MEGGLFDQNDICSSVRLPYLLFKAWTKLHEILYVHYGTWAHRSNVLHEYSQPISLLAIIVPAVVSRQRLSKTLPRQQIHKLQEKNCWLVVSYVILAVILFFLPNDINLTMCELWGPKAVITNGDFRRKPLRLSSGHFMFQSTVKFPAEAPNLETDIEFKNCVFWDVTPCDSCNNRRFGGT
jgi:hypothetical protein